MKKIDYTKLKILRKEKGITQKAMSKMLNMTQSNYSKLENGLKKIDSLNTLERLAEVLEMTTNRLKGVLLSNENIQSSGMQSSELLQIEKIISENPLRENEFVFFSTEVLEIDKFDFKEMYNGFNLKNLNENEAFPFWQLPVEMNIILASQVDIGFEYEKKKLMNIGVWLSNKKLGIIDIQYNELVDNLINLLLISRVLLIENPNSIGGYFDSYMKVVFVSTNAVCKSANFENGRFSKLNFLSQDEVEEIDKEYLDLKYK
ncbi:MAG: Helix-turn-helix domain [Bacteroidota bacterium]|jgi:transcriptional regulator with XRE-family HTH domain